MTCVVIHPSQPHPAARRLIGVLPPCLIAIVAMLLPAIRGASERLQFDRSQLLAGQWDRLLTCHLAHFGGSHLAWDASVLIGLGVAAAAIDGRRTLIAIVTSAVAVPLAILVGQPGLQTYRGLSGIDSALYTLLAVMLLRQAIRDRQVAIAGSMAAGLIGFVAKIAYELSTGQTFFVTPSTEFVPVPLAHAVGAVCGAVVGCIGLASPPRILYATPLAAGLKKSRRRRKADEIDGFRQRSARPAAGGQ